MAPVSNILKYVKCLKRQTCWHCTLSYSGDAINDIFFNELVQIQFTLTSTICALHKSKITISLMFILVNCLSFFRNMYYLCLLSIPILISNITLSTGFSFVIDLMTTHELPLKTDNVICLKRQMNLHLKTIYLSLKSNGDLCVRTAFHRHP